jgi:xanthine dehydrogenase YagS FAD-binding subunit
VSVALAVVVDGDRVTAARALLGGVAPLPWRSHAAEQSQGYLCEGDPWVVVVKTHRYPGAQKESLVGGRLEAATARRTADAAIRGAEPMEQNGYKVPLLHAAVEKSVLDLATGGA